MPETRQYVVQTVVHEVVQTVTEYITASATTGSTPTPTLPIMAAAAEVSSLAARVSSASVRLSSAAAAARASNVASRVSSCAAKFSSAAAAARVSSAAATVSSAPAAAAPAKCGGTFVHNALLVFSVIAGVLLVLVVAFLFFLIVGVGPIIARDLQEDAYLEEQYRATNAGQRDHTERSELEGEGSSGDASLEEIEEAWNITGKLLMENAAAAREQARMQIAGRGSREEDSRETEARIQNLVNSGEASGSGQQSEVGDEWEDMGDGRAKIWGEYRDDRELKQSELQEVNLRDLGMLYPTSEKKESSSWIAVEGSSSNECSLD